MKKPTKKQLDFLFSVSRNEYQYSFVSINGRVLPDQSHIRACIWNKWVDYIDGGKCTLTKLGREQFKQNKL